jgi:ribose 5-phosphate isomerase B
MLSPHAPRPPHLVMRDMAMLHIVRVYLGSDHAGFELKAFLVQHLTRLGHDVVDVGPDVFDADDDYPPFCIETARQVMADPGSLGVVIGGSGNGEQICANKVAGCRAALAWSTETARLAREHNDAQVVGVGARMHAPAEAAEIVETFLATPFSGGERHARRIRLISDFEATGDAPPISAG